MKRYLTQWYVRIKYKYEPAWHRFPPEGPFSSKEEAEDHARNLFGIEKWEARAFRLTQKQARQMEFIDRRLKEFGEELRSERKNAKVN